VIFGGGGKSCRGGGNSMVLCDWPALEETK
jgi:hypothetical protein